MRPGLLIKVKYGLTPGKIINNCAILCRNGRIHAIGGSSAFKNAEYTHEIELENCYAAPGFVYTHVYGVMGFSVMDHHINNSLQKISEILGEHGVTTFVPTLQATSLERELELLESLSDIENGTEFSGAEPYGLHMIGPFISSAHKGANPSEGIRPEVDFEELDRILNVAGEMIKIMTFAPELKGAQKLIETILEYDIKPSMGHSAATAREVLAAIDAGAKRCTHLYNAMAPLHQRRIGLATTSLIDDRITAELIIDGYHIHPQMINLACRSKSSDNIIAVSGASQGSGLPDGEYTFGTQKVKIDNQHCILEDGTIAGSMVTHDKCWKNILEFTDIKPIEAIKYFTSNPARDLDLMDRGHLHPGLRADIAILDENTNEVLVTVKGGEIIYACNKDLIKEVKK